MKFLSVRDVKARFSACIEESQKEGVVITNHGKPEAVLIGVENYDAEDVMLMASPRFWRMIEARRKQPTTSLEDFKEELKREGKRRRRRSR